MREEFLHFIWDQQLYNTSNLVTASGDEVIVDDTGYLNKLSGPDFHEAKVKIGETLWAGSVEIHVKSSDWFKHNHEPDNAYGNVILHVVYEHDIIADGFYEIPVLELKGRITRKTIEKFETLKASKSKIPCESLIREVPQRIKAAQLKNSAVDRLKTKVAEIQRNHKQNRGDTDITFYRTLLKAFGFKANTLAFDELAVRTPFYIVKKCAHVKGMLEALFIGQAGMFPANPRDQYQEKLLSDYTFLKTKYGLQPGSSAAWKTGGVRPGNQPVLRLAQLAALFESNPNISSEVYKSDPNILKQMFAVELNPYWDERFTLQKVAQKSTAKKLNEKAVENIIINTIAPFLYFMGDKRDRPELKEKAMDLLANTKPENSSEIKNWKSLGLHFSSALETQGALQLKKDYCTKVKCLHCEIGKYIVG